MNHLQNKIIKFLGNAAGWLFGVMFILMGLVNLSQHPIATLIIVMGGALMLPPVYQFITKKTQLKLQQPTVATIGLIISFVAIGNSAPTNPDQQTPQALVSSQPIPSQPVQTNQPKQTVVAPVVVPVQQATKTQEQSTAIQSNYDVNCKVVGVSDGDTFTCLTNDKQQLKIRMNQIDAPEKNQDFGQASKNALSGMIFGKIIGLKTNGTDKYGRTIAEAFYDGKNINKAMVAGGYAWAYREYMTDNEYASLETTARSNTTGLWSQPNPTYPSDFRRMGKGQTTAPTQTQEIATTIAPTVSDSGASCGSKRYCKQMATCAEARHYLNDCGVSRLDRDGDGVPCESLCN